MRISDWSSDVCSSDLDLLAHQIEPGDHLGDRMFDLKPGVHLDEVECAVFPQELDRPRAAIAHIGHRLGDDAAHPITLDAAQARRGGFLEHLLVAALERAVALAEMVRLSQAIAEDLEFDVSSGERRVGKEWVSTCRS